MKYDVVIVGGGAAGLICAIEAGKRGRRTLVLEHNRNIGEKIRISGGGRCNFTNIHTTPDHFISANRNFPKSALARFTPQDFISLVRRHGIAFHEKKLGQLFCDGSSREIIDMLLAECRSAGVDVRTGCTVGEIRANAGFALETNQGAMLCQSVVIACGGLSIPKIGASDFGYRIARQFGHRIVETRPGLVPLTFGRNDSEMFRGLSGVALDATVSVGKATFRENVLITHRGLSGPAILQISSFWKKGTSIAIDLLTDVPRGGELSSKTLTNFVLKRFAQRWCEHFAPQKPVAQWSKKELAAFADGLRQWTFRPDGSEGYAKAEVTLGGVDTTELSSKTMASERARGLYFVGEVVDVTGQLGGFNFQWAWSSGFVAGQYA